jgi:hypothetical protein
MQSQPPANSSPADIELGLQELYFGYARGRIGNAGGFQKDGPANYSYAVSPAEGVFYARGRWTARAEYLESAAEGANSILIKYSGAGVRILMAPPQGGMAEVGVRQDGASLPEHLGTADTRPPWAGAPERGSYIRVDRLRLYAVVDNRECGSHVLELTFRAAGLRLYACTFTGLPHFREQQSPAA